MSSPINPPVARGVRNGELPAYVSNGLIGLRVREQPLQAGMCLVSGVAGEPAERRIEAAAPSPYPLAADIALNGVWISDQPSAVSDLVQAYDFATGELTSRFRFEGGGRVAQVTVVTFAIRDAAARRQAAQQAQAQQQAERARAAAAVAATPAAAPPAAATTRPAPATPRPAARAPQTPAAGPTVPAATPAPAPAPGGAL
jgi:hypothetical protein